MRGQDTHPASADHRLGQASARSSRPATAGSLCGALPRAFDFPPGTGAAAFSSWLLPFWFIYSICFLSPVARSSAHQCATRPGSGVSPVVGNLAKGPMVTESSGSKSGEGALTGQGAGPGTPIPGSVAPGAPCREAGAPSQPGLPRGLHLSSRSPTPG